MDSYKKSALPRFSIPAPIRCVVEVAKILIFHKAVTIGRTWKMASALERTKRGVACLLSLRGAYQNMALFAGLFIGNLTPDDCCLGS